VVLEVYHLPNWYVEHYKPWQEIRFDGKLDGKFLARCSSILLLSWSRISCCLLAASGKSDALGYYPDGNLVRACQDAALHDVVLSLPGAIVPTSEGATNLSEGQASRTPVLWSTTHLSDG